jgi:uncharacterized protein YegJ (DUF2314 family)
MPNYAVVNPQGGVVSNIVVGDNLESVKEVISDVVEITEETGVAGIGYTWNPATGTFSFEE